MLKTFSEENTVRRYAGGSQTPELAGGGDKIYPDEAKRKNKLDTDIRSAITDRFFEMLKKPAFTEADQDTVYVFIKDYLRTNKVFFADAQDGDDFVDNIINDIFGFGVIQKLINDSSVQEIFVEGRRGVFYESNGARFHSTMKFKNENSIKTVINKILAPINRKVDESTPLVDARLPDGSRVAITMPPVALNGPTIDIRKFKKDKFGLADYVRTGSMSQTMADFLSLSVKAGLNILIAGGTGSGKTTLLNALSNEIPSDGKKDGRGVEHIITIEDSAELQIPQPFVSSWETKNANAEGYGKVDSSDLLKHALRNAPDRIILGEMRDKVAFDVLQAVNTGHDGTMSTIHCNDSAAAISRFADLTAESGIMTSKEAESSFAESFDLIVFVDKFFDIRDNWYYRKVTQITYVAGMGKSGASHLKLASKDVDESHAYLQDLFVYDKIARKFRCRGFFPLELESKLRQKGYAFPKDMFVKGESSPEGGSAK